MNLQKAIWTGDRSQNNAHVLWPSNLLSGQPAREKYYKAGRVAPRERSVGLLMSAPGAKAGGSPQEAMHFYGTLARKHPVTTKAVISAGCVATGEMFARSPGCKGQAEPRSKFSATSEDAERTLCPLLRMVPISERPSHSRCFPRFQAVGQAAVFFSLEKYRLKEESWVSRSATRWKMLGVTRACSPSSMFWIRLMTK